MSKDSSERESFTPRILDINRLFRIKGLDTATSTSDAACSLPSITEARGAPWVN
jgi:hypothetical protein